MLILKFIQTTYYYCLKSKKNNTYIIIIRYAFLKNGWKQLNMYSIMVRIRYYNHQ